MWKEIKEAVLLLIVLFLLSCFVAFVLFAAILLLPVVLLAIGISAIKEIVTSRKRAASVTITRSIVNVREPVEEEERTPIREIFSRFKEQVSYQRRQNKWSF